MSLRLSQGLPAASGRNLAAWRRGLVGSPVNLLITLGFLGIVLGVVVPFLRWAVVDATWTGSRADCAVRGGACWAFIGEKFRFVFLGLYPQGASLQAVAATALIGGLAAVAAIPPLRRRLPLAVTGPLVIALAIAVMGGFVTGQRVSTQQWGGFPLTLLITAVALAAAFPLSVALALGRRSGMGLVRLLCVGAIEVMRGVPMIAVLYVSTLLFPLMLPAGASLDKLLRAQIAITLFVAAYMAEIVRSGLHAVAAGQEEAARALGLSWWRTMRLIVLPQALRAVISSFVNLGIGLFLDTTLVIVIGLLDFLNTAKTAATDARWPGVYNEAYVFAALVYFIICFGASRYSLGLERRLTPDR